ncbi:MAG: hypothetical protein M1837_005990 [Sclerophora amabilis]|nr:MAG: hypothetical protein M1837_005990 [Sclerophora amabilis]
MSSHANNQKVVALQWSLNHTVDDCLKISRDLMRAATSDDVQGLALDVVGRFGTTLAICSETQNKVETALRQMRSNRWLGVLKAHVGFSAGDSCDALLSSSGGLRFLALAATFMTGDHFEAAQATHSMITECSSRNQLLPTVGQLHALFKVLEHKLATLGFTDLVMKWHLRLRDGSHALPSAQSSATADTLQSRFPYVVEAATNYPNAATMTALISALREVWRLGEGSKLEIRAGISTPWLIAFIDWCVGASPKVLLKDGTVLLDDSLERSKIELWAFTEANEVEIRVYARIDGLSRLWRTSGNPNADKWAGMVSLQHFAKRFIFTSNLDSGLGKRAMCQALVYSTFALASRIAVLHDREEKSRDRLDEKHGLLRSRTNSTLQHFSRHISLVLYEYLDLDTMESCRLRRLEEGQLLEDLSAVKAYIQSIEAECDCARCGDQATSIDSCSVHEFQYSISAITAQIVALSLFDCTEPVKLYFRGARYNYDAPVGIALIAKAGKILFPESQFRKFLFAGTLDIPEAQLQQGMAVSASDLFELALALVGHEIPTADIMHGGWIASAKKGQVIYPRILEIQHLDPRGLLLLDGGPGTLYHDKERYELVKGAGLRKSMRSDGVEPPADQLHDQPVSCSQNFLTDEKLEWLVSPTKTCLTLGCRIIGDSVQFNPFVILDTAAQSLFVSRCPHDPTATFEKADREAYYIVRSEHRRKSHPDKIPVLAVHRNEDMRFLAFGWGDPAVVSLGACLQCCLDICRSSERYKFVIC